MRRDIFSDEHDHFRAEFRRFAEAEIVPHLDAWNERGISDRSAWRKMGESGFLGANAPEEYGGGGADFLFDAIVMEELAYLRAHALQMSLHSDICMPYLSRPTPARKRRRRSYLTGAIAGECHPGGGDDRAGHAGSDLARDPDPRRARRRSTTCSNGAKTFISNGQICDLVIVVAQDRPRRRPARTSGISLLLVEGDTPGLRARPQPRRSSGSRARTRASSSSSDCRVPVGNLLGKEGQGFSMLMETSSSRSGCASPIGLDRIVSTLARRHRRLRARSATPSARRSRSFQNTQFTLAELATEVEIGQAFVDKLLAAHVRGEEIVKEVSMAKWWASDLQKKVAGECLQLFGGYGFMEEYPISQDYRDAAVQSIYAGTNEIMKVIIARRMGLS